MTPRTARQYCCRRLVCKCAACNSETSDFLNGGPTAATLLSPLIVARAGASPPCSVQGDNRGARSGAVRAANSGAPSRGSGGKDKSGAKPQTTKANGSSLPTPRLAKAASTPKEDAPSTAAKREVDSILRQIKLVEQCIDIADGEHKAIQERARVQLQSSLGAARQRLAAATPVAARRSQLESRTTAVREKLKKNQDLLCKAQAHVARLEGFVASQSRRLQELTLELQSLPDDVSPSPSPPTDPVEAATLDDVPPTPGGGC